MQIDTSTEFGKRVERRLENEQIVWLTTVSPASKPYSVPVWSWWDGDTALIYSQPDTPKVRNIEANPNVELHFDGDGSGGNIVHLSGMAAVDPDAPPATGVPEMIEKYTEGIQRIGTTPESFAEGYSVAIRVRPEKVRGH